MKLAEKPSKKEKSYKVYRLECNGCGYWSELNEMAYVNTTNHICPLCHEYNRKVILCIRMWG